MPCYRPVTSLCWSAYNNQWLLIPGGPDLLGGDMQTSNVRRLGALAFGLALVASACGSSSSGTAASGKCSGIKLAFIGALSGDNGNLGKNMVNGAKVAIDEFNAAHPDCQVGFDTSYDSQGDPAQATPLASKIVNDASIVGLIGPGFSGESKATMPTFEAAGLPMITPGATNANPYRGAVRCRSVRSRCGYGLPRR